MTIDPTTNPTVKGHVWKTDAGGQGNTRVTFATASYMNGRIACIGDSSPADDGTGDPNDNLFFGWDQASGGVNNKEIHLNAIAWLAGPDTTAPSITSGPSATPADCTASIDWSTDEASDSRVDYGPTAAYGLNETEASLTTAHSIVLSGLTPSATYHYRAGSADSSGNGPTWSADATFNTTPPAVPMIVSGPTVTQIGPTSATVTWTTDEPSNSTVHYGLTASYGDMETDAQLVTEHAVQLTGLATSMTYHFSVESTDGCTNGPTMSADDTFVTAAAQIDLSGWTLEQFNSSQSFVFPPGTVIPGNGYLVLARDADQVSFETEWGPLPAGTVFVDSAGTLPFINGGESFRLIDNGAVIVDGPTISMSSGTTIQRNNPGDPPGSASSWTTAGSAAGSPGSGAGAASSAGVVINEASDASSFVNEFVELYYDAIPAGPDVTAPAQVTDLVATPESDTAVRLTWTAPGDDGTTGQATSYDLRRASTPILDEAAFAAALSVTAPTPTNGGDPESFLVTGLTEEMSYFFAIRASDEVPNTGELSNTAGATTGPIGSGTGPGTADHLVISEVQTRGLVGANDEFIELYNPTDSSVSIDGWSVQYKSASGTTFLRHDLPAVSIPAGGYFLLTRPPGEHLHVADVLAALEVGLEQCLHHPVLRARRALRIPDEAMRGERVGLATDCVEGERDRLLRARGLHARVHRPGPVHAPELGREVVGPLHAFDGHVGVELERAPVDLDRHRGARNERSRSSRRMPRSRSWSGGSRSTRVTPTSSRVSPWSA